MFLCMQLRSYHFKEIQRKIEIPIRNDTGNLFIPEKSRTAAAQQDRDTGNRSLSAVRLRESGPSDTAGVLRGSTAQGFVHAGRSSSIQ